MFSKYVLTFFFVYHNAAQAYICCTLGVLCQFDAQICETCSGEELSGQATCTTCTNGYYLTNGICSGIYIPIHVICTSYINVDYD